MSTQPQPIQIKGGKIRWPSRKIGQYSFQDLYPQWPEVLAQTELALNRELKDTPRHILVEPSRFRQVFLDEMRDNQSLGLSQEAAGEVFADAYDHFFGLGMISYLLEDTRVEDILCDNSDAMDVVVGGEKHRLQTPWVNDQDLYRWLQRMVNTRGRDFSEQQAMVSAHLADGSRIFALCPPITERPCFSLRRHADMSFVTDQYRGSGIGPAALMDFLEFSVLTRENIFISGSTGSGKSTMLNWLASLCPPDDRLLIVEDTRELRVPHPRALSLQATLRGASINREDGQVVSIRDLVEGTLRMRPTRIVVGECRGAEAFDMLQAMAAGHPGSFTTVHANNPSEAIGRLEALAAQGMENMPLWALQKLINTTVGLVIQIMEIPELGRRIVEVAQVIHPEQIEASLRDAPGNDRQRDDLIVRTLWLWDDQARECQHLLDPIPMKRQYLSAQRVLQREAPER